MNTIEIISVIFGAGGLGTFIGSYIIFYKAKKRKQNAEAKDLEIDNEQSRVDWIETRLKSRDDKIDAMYIELRTEQNQRHRAEIELEVLKLKRCDVRGCKERQPPSDY